MSSIWGNRKQSALAAEKSAQRLDCFLSVVYLFPNCLHAKDVELLAMRDRELTAIYRYGAYGFLGMYTLASMGSIMMKRRLPYFRQAMKHSMLAGAGTFCAGLAAEKVAAEVYYNKLMISLADKYNFTPEEVMDLQRNLNQYYIKKDREADMNKE
tara:strand:- start:708 stop:1172 length:465 start_codon:yes stop_codon:yes gene_type:complete